MGSLIVTGLLLEVAALMIFGEQPKFPRYVIGREFGVRTNIPNSHYRHKSADVTVWFRINGQGMRADRNYKYERPDGRKRIISLGDSFTVGYEVSYEDCFSSVMESELRRRGYDVEVLNAGVSGFSNAEECVYLERELLKYRPDMVVVSFFGNDLVDNIRTDLFMLEGDVLVEGSKNYVPMGRLANFLNTNFVFQYLSTHSNAFVIIKEKLTHLFKSRIVEQNVRNLERAEEAPKGTTDSYSRRLAAAILHRILRTTRKHNIPLVIHSIPSLRDEPLRLVEMLPLEELRGKSMQGAYLLLSKKLLAPYLGKQPLYHQRSHGHWTPLAHRLTGEGLAEFVVRKGLLQPK